MELPEGGGEVKLGFLPKGMKTGAMLSISGACLLILMLFIMKSEKKSEMIGKAAERAVYALSIAAFSVCYIVAPLLWAAVNIISLVVGG